MLGRHNIVQICSLNCSGLNDRKKRGMLAKLVRYCDIEVLCLQETHIPWNNRAWLKELGLDLIVCSRQATTTRGVAILARQGVCVTKQAKADNCGCWAIAEVEIRGASYTICSVYGSNLDDPSILHFLSIELAQWSSPTKIMCGDFNIHLDSDFDLGSMACFQGRKWKTFRALKGLCDEYALVDVWQKLRPTEPGYTFYSAPHSKGVRLDYFFVSECILGSCMCEHTH